MWWARTFKKAPASLRENPQDNDNRARFERLTVIEGRFVNCRWCKQKYVYDGIINIKLFDHTQTKLQEAKEYISRPRKLFMAPHNSHGSPDNFEHVMAEHTIEDYCRFYCEFLQIFFTKLAQKLVVSCAKRILLNALPHQSLVRLCNYFAERWASVEGKFVHCRWCNQKYIHDGIVNVRLVDHTRSELHQNKEYIIRPNRKLYTAQRNSHGSPDKFEVVMAEHTIDASNDDLLDSY